LILAARHLLDALYPPRAAALLAGEAPGAAPGATDLGGRDRCVQGSRPWPCARDTAAVASWVRCALRSPTPDELRGAPERALAVTRPDRRGCLARPLRGNSGAFERALLAQKDGLLRRCARAGLERCRWHQREVRAAGSLFLGGERGGDPQCEGQRQQQHAGDQGRPLHGALTRVSPSMAPIIALPGTVRRHPLGAFRARGRRSRLARS